MAKNSEFKEAFLETDEMKFDSRLIDKKIAHKFLTRDDREQYLKQLPEEKEYEFTSMAEVEKLEDIPA